jgi:hypothetical protein
MENRLMPAPPSNITIIRHAEKPPNPPNTTGPYDVQEDGTSGKGKSLIVQGWQRAGALVTFFAPHGRPTVHPSIVKPDYIFAANPEGETQRPYETVAPLAAWLNYRPKTPQFNIDYSVGKGEKDMVATVLGLGGNVLICWEHDNIMPNIIDAINTSVPIDNYKDIPSKWPGVFYLIWILQLDGKKYKWSSHKQNLIAGDRS